MFGPPKILPTSDKIVTVRLGAEAVLTCDSFAIPLPDKVTILLLINTNTVNLNISTKDIVWLHHDVPLAPSEHYSISKAAKVDGLVSSLRVRRVGLPDLGEYSCSIANGHGEDRRTVKLNRVGQWMVVYIN